MDFLKPTFLYLFRYGRGKRFLLPWLFVLIPSLIVGTFFPTSKYIALLVGFSTAEYPTFGALWLDSFNTSGWAFLGLAVAAVLFVFSVSYLCALVTRHIRVGKLTFPNFFRAVNNYFFPALAVTVFFLLVAFIAHLLFVVFAWAWLHLASRVAGLVMICIFFALILVGMAYLLSATTLWLPLMSFTGVYVFRGFGIAFYKSRNHQRKFFLPCLIAFALAFAIGAVGYFIPVWYVNALLHALVYSVILTVTIVFTFISYCESESVKREDLAGDRFGR